MTRVLYLLLLRITNAVDSVLNGDKLKKVVKFKNESETIFLYLPLFLVVTC